MPKGKKSDELVYFCSGIPVTRARAQEIRASPKKVEEPPLRMPSSPILLRSGRILRSPKPSKVDPNQDPVCQLLSKIINKHRKSPRPEEEAINLELQQILKPLSNRSGASTSTCVHTIWPISPLLPSITSISNPLRLSPTKTGSSPFDVTGHSPDKPRSTTPPSQAIRLEATNPKVPSSPRSLKQPLTRSAKVYQACGIVLGEVVGRVATAIRLSPRQKSPHVLQRTPPKSIIIAREPCKPIKSAAGAPKPVKYVDRGTSPRFELVTTALCEEPIGDPGFRFQSVGNKNISEPQQVTRRASAGLQKESPQRRSPLRTRSFRPRTSPSPRMFRRRAYTFPCSIL